MQRILIVEDEAALSKNVAQSLRRNGVDVKTAKSGDEARAVLQAGSISFLCLDVGLPDCDGLDLLKEIREIYPRLPTVVMTAHDTRRNRARATELNATAFLSKPFSLAELGRIVFHQTSKEPPLSDIDTPSSFGKIPAVEEEPPTLMMYSHDSIGLGHMRRNSSIAGALAEKLPQASILMTVGCPTGMFFDVPESVDSLKLPSVQKTATNTWRPRSLNISPLQSRKLRAGLIQQTAKIIKPHVFLADHLPTGVWGELVPTLKALRSVSNPPKIILGLRDILDTPEVIRETWAREGLYELVEKYYDGVFIYGRKEIYDTAGLYGLTEAVPQKIHYCGYLSGGYACDNTTEFRNRLALTREQLVVVTAGGGSDAYPMMAATLKAFSMFDPRDCPEAVFITGPLMAKCDRWALRTAARGLPVRILSTVHDVPNWLHAADLVVTMGGYNTMMESIRFARRIVVIPRTGPSAEQRIRSKLFNDLGFVSTVLPDQAAPERLAGAIRRSLMDEPARRPPFEFDGLHNATTLLADLFVSKRASVSGGRQAALAWGRS